MIWIASMAASCIAVDAIVAGFAWAAVRCWIGPALDRRIDRRIEARKGAPS